VFVPLISTECRNPIAHSGSVGRYARAPALVLVAWYAPSRFFTSQTLRPGVETADVNQMAVLAVRTDERFGGERRVVGTIGGISPRGGGAGPSITKLSRRAV